MSNLLFDTDLELAVFMHDIYEIISKKKNWNTQKKCKVKFENLPKENKEVMLEVAKLLNQHSNYQMEFKENLIRADERKKTLKDFCKKIEENQAVSMNNKRTKPFCVGNIVINKQTFKEIKGDELK